MKQTQQGALQARRTGDEAAADQGRRPRDLSALERAEILVQASALSGEERGAFLRKRGLFEENIKSWILSLERLSSKASTQKTMGQAKRIAELERELRRKDKALAEAAALLVLKKKLGILLGDDEEQSTSYRPGKRS